MLARYENYVDLDPVVKDKWGIPSLCVFTTSSATTSTSMAEDMKETAQEMFEAAGFEIVHVNNRVLTEGWSIHELGTARMGNDPEDLGAESISAVARRQESVRGGWQRFRERQLPESHVDHHVVVLALVRLSRGRTRQRQSAKETRCPQDDPINLKQDRRQWLKTSATVLGASLLPLPGSGPEARQTSAGHAAREADRNQIQLRDFFTPAQHTLVEELSETIIPADSHSGRREGRQGCRLHRAGPARKLR